MDFQFDNEDLNGECLIGNPEGEQLVRSNLTNVPFSHDSPAAADGQHDRAVVFNNAQAMDFVQLQLGQIRAADNTIVLADASKIAYLRFLAARLGLISPAFVPANYHVDYNDAGRIGAHDDHAAGLGDWDQASIRGALTAPVKRRLRECFVDLVCMVAYMFRVRGHHYLDDMEGKYDTLWQRCLRRIEDKPVAWVHVARTAFHAIMPSVLDGFWVRCANAGLCSGAMIKRVDSAPAGSSGILALKKGVSDVQLILPGAFEVVSEQLEALDQLVAQVQGNRWGASVNHRYYGVPRIRIDEGAVGVLASVALGVYTQLAPQAELRNAPSLQRMATLAPVTGGAIGRMAVATVQSGRRLLLAQEEQ